MRGCANSELVVFIILHPYLTEDNSDWCVGVLQSRHRICHAEPQRSISHSQTRDASLRLSMTKMERLINPLPTSADIYRVTAISVCAAGFAILETLPSGQRISRRSVVAPCGSPKWIRGASPEM